jgi:hypothetical protein
MSLEMMRLYPVFSAPRSCYIENVIHCGPHEKMRKVEEVACTYVNVLLEFATLRLPLPVDWRTRFKGGAYASSNGRLPFASSSLADCRRLRELDMVGSFY